MAQHLYKPLLIDSILAQTALIKQRFVGFNGRVCAANTLALGICDVETDQGQYAPIAISGILLIEAGGAITQGSKVTSDASGRAVTGTVIDTCNGYAMDAATAAGDIIRIVRGI